MTRDEKVAKAHALRRKGLTYKQIAPLVGTSVTTVFRWLNADYAEADRAKARARKENYRGVCVDCGAPTNGSNGPGTAAERCSPCSNAHRAKWTRETVIAAIQRFAERYGRPPQATDFNPHQALSLGHDWRAERFRNDGDYPQVVCVQYVFGTWNAAIEAAGFEPTKIGAYRRIPHGRSGGLISGAHLEAERQAA